MIFNYRCQMTPEDWGRLVLASERPCGVVGFLNDGTAVVPHASLEEFQAIEALCVLGADCCSCLHDLRQMRREFELRIQDQVESAFSALSVVPVWAAVERSARRFWDIWFPGSVARLKILLRDIFFGDRRAKPFRDGFVCEVCRMLEEITGSPWYIQPAVDCLDLCADPVVYTSGPPRLSARVSFAIPDLARSPCEKVFYVLWRKEFAVIAAKICYRRRCRREILV